ncbi:MAG: MtnX-like HAD-IB family phosphatase [Ignavibacteriales bacterium]|nr:MtnX-like HAD-IB family phosphatase [Ignavibacteriales bacterium]
MLRVFSDFDGTIALEDVGSQLFRRFAGSKADEIVLHLLDGTISARECLTQECGAVEDAPLGELEQFVNQFSLDPAFEVFVEFCRHRNIPVVVLSDGLDFYVDRLLRKHGLGDLPYFSNHLDLVDHGGVTKLVPSFPHTDAECLTCGNCKRNHLLTLSGDDDIIVYIGDGISDRCPVRFADIVFAKGRLIRYCQEQNISYHEFNTFDDVRRRLETILQQKRIRKRREAEMARRDVFAQG